MRNYLISEAIGDIAGSAYEGKTRRIKDYNKVKLFSSRARFTDDTVLTFACAEAFIDNLDMTMNLWKCANEHRHAGFGSKFKLWFASHNPRPYRSRGNGAAMRCSSAGWLAKSEEECIRMATETAAPTHNHPEGIKGAVATALTIFHLKNGKDKDFVREHLLKEFYPDWGKQKYADFHDSYTFNSTCEGTVGPAMICFLESKDYVDCIKLAISLGGDSDTLAAISGPMAYAYYKKMPDALVSQALKMLPDWMVDVSERFDEKVVASCIEYVYKKQFHKACGKKNDRSIKDLFYLCNKNSKTLFKMKKFGRIIGAVVLAIVACIFVNACTLLSFGGLAHLIQNLSFLNVIAFSIILGFAGSIVFTLAALILYGLSYLSRGSKLIGIIVTIILLNSFINDYALLIAGIPNGPAGAKAIEMISEAAGSYYMLGAIITLIVDFACYVVCSIACFVNPDE